MNEMIPKETGTEQKLWIIGDSFTGMRHLNESWAWKLYQSFVGKHVYVSSRGTRDYQTVIDIFLRKLKYIKKDDFVILFLPTLSRFRLPLDTPLLDEEWCSDSMNFGIKNKNLDYFIGGSLYASNDESIIQKKLEFPLNTISNKQWANDSTDKLLSPADIIKSINVSNASIKNSNEILDSLKKSLPFQLYLVSWENELDEKIVDTKDIITNNIGFWETLDVEFVETNGKSGKKYDVHWSKKMDSHFADYIMKTYPHFFK